MNQPRAGDEAWIVARARTFRLRMKPGSRAAVLRRSEPTRVSVGERRQSRRVTRAIRAARAQRVKQSDTGSRAAVLRRSEPTRFSVGERRRSRRVTRAIRAERAQRVEQSDTGSRAAVLRRSEPTRFSVGERRQSRRVTRAIRAGAERRQSNTARPDAQKTCRKVTIGHPKIRAVPVRPFRRSQEIVQMCLRSLRQVRGRRHQASCARGSRYPPLLTGSLGCRLCQASI